MTSYGAYCLTHLEELPMTYLKYEASFVLSYILKRKMEWVVFFQSVFSNIIYRNERIRTELILNRWDSTYLIGHSSYINYSKSTDLNRITSCNLYPSSSLWFYKRTPIIDCYYSREILPAAIYQLVKMLILYFCSIIAVITAFNAGPGMYNYYCYLHQ